MHGTFIDAMTKMNLFDWQSTLNTLDYRLSLEQDNVMKLEVDVPGVRHEDLTLDHEKDVITIVSKRPNHLRRSLQLRIADTYDLTTARATLNYGVLTVKINPKKVQESKRIPIQLL